MQTNCTYCGAVLSLDHYEDRLQFDYCDTLHIPSLREDGLVEKLEGVPSTTDCAVCFAGLRHARVDRWHFLYCRACHGLLIDDTAFLNIVLYRRQAATEPYLEPEPIEPGDLHRRVRCPDCKDKMSTHPYYGPGSFIIDSCRHCKQVWLDGGVLDKASQSGWGGSLWQ